MAERITVEKLGKVYPGGNQALHEVSLDVDPGTFLVLLGPSGSGKTTLLRSVAGIERVTSGRILIGDRAVADGRLHVPPDRRELSMVFQDYALWPHLTIRDNVAFALRRRRLSRAECGQRSTAMLERVGLGALAERYPNELSGGEQQRVALARALVADTGLILCDEPLSNLDADLRERMRLEISSLVRDAGATTMYITHDQAEAFALADRVGVLERGRLVQTGTPEEIYTRPASPFVARFTGLSGEFTVRLRGPAGNGSAPDSAGTAAAAGGWEGTEGTEGTAEVEIARDGATGPVPGDAARPFRARLPREPLTGDTGLLMVRPTGLSLVGLHTGEHHLAGTVADVAFRGRGYEHAIDLPGYGRLTGVFAPVRASRGETVGLRLDPTGCHLFAAATAPASAGESPHRPPAQAGGVSERPVQAAGRAAL